MSHFTDESGYWCLTTEEDPLTFITFQIYLSMSDNFLKFCFNETVCFSTVGFVDMDILDVLIMAGLDPSFLNCLKSYVGGTMS